MQTQDDINFRGRVDLKLEKHRRFRDRIRMMCLVFAIASSVFAGIAYGWATGLFIICAMLWMMVLVNYVQRTVAGDWEPR